MRIVRTNHNIPRDFMPFWVKLQSSDEVGVEIIFCDAKSMEMMIIAPFYNVFGCFRHHAKNLCKPLVLSGVVEGAAAT